MDQLFQNVLNAENERQEIIARIADKLRQLDLSGGGKGKGEPMFGIGAKLGEGSDRSKVVIMTPTTEPDNASIVGMMTDVTPV